MAKPVDQKEAKRRLAAFEETKKHVHGGSVAKAAEALGDISPNALSRFLLNRGIKTDRQPEFSKEQCIEAIKASVAKIKKLPTRDRFMRDSAIGVKWRSHWSRWDDFLSAAGVIGDKSKILLIDIETAPMMAMVWGTRKQYINHEWIAQNGYILCWSAKWLGEAEIIFKRFQNGKPLSLLQPIHKLLDEAHAVVHYNGKKFDVPTLNREFLIHGMTPPSPYKQVDCLQTMWDTFAFPSNKLDYIAKTLGVGQKIDKEGPQFWTDCMADKPEAWKKMEAYNRHDVVLLEGVYKKILPWIKKHPNRAALSGMEICPSCGSHDINLDPRPYVANQLKYEQFNCGECGVWFRGTKSINPRGEKRFALAG